MKRILPLIICLSLFMFGCTDNLNVNLQNESTTERNEVSQETTVEATQDQMTFVTEPEFDPMSVVSQFSDEELVGQLFLVCYPDDTLSLEHIETYHLGGYVLFGKDFKNETPESITNKLSEQQKHSSIPLLFAVDEEGGTVTRVSSYTQFRKERFSSPRNLYSFGGVEAILNEEAEKCQLLKKLGINVILGPVCDITQNPDAFMYDRSLGEDAQTTAQFACAVIDTMEQYQVGGVLKHFPGYGNNSDTHFGIATDHRTLEELLENDLVPFQAAINQDCDAIMISHTYVESIDPKMPASLSSKVVCFLRNEMGFNGVIMTDDLSMGAISAQYDSEASAVIALKAGIDMLCCTDYPNQYRAVLKALQSGEINRAQLETSACRIILWKHDLGLL